MMIGKRTAVVLGLLMAGATLVGCTQTDSRPAAAQQDKAIDVAKARQNYQPTNDVEGRNYNARLKIADDPATLLWCTAFPTNPSAPLITVPIVGKLTSGSKRPFPTSQSKIGSKDTNGFTYSPEVPGPDGMYGTSGEYRYGFRPDGVYVDFYNLETYCTTEPTTFQREHTFIDLKSADPNNVDAKVQEALKACQAAQKDKTTVTACAEAQRLLISGVK